MYYCNARYYSPKWRRFISPDETSYLDAESVNGLNQYCYCNNDPINYTDPSGRFPLLAAIIVAAIAIGCGVHAGFYEGNIYNDIRGQSGSTEKEPLSVWDRINNILIGTTLGLAIGGAVVMLGAMGVAAVVGATTYVVA